MMVPIGSPLDWKTSMVCAGSGPYATICGVEALATSSDATTGGFHAGTDTGVCGPAVVVELEALLLEDEEQAPSVSAAIIDAASANPASEARVWRGR
jgi:hypothetical protein